MTEANIPSTEDYRKCSLGRFLQTTLSALLAENKITQEQANIVFNQFDKSIIEAINTKVRSNITFKGHCISYRNVADTWQQLLENTVINTDTKTIECKYIKMLATDVNNK
eukprot:TRINITY_DN17315_c0_g1_i1.p1 TRINITY_DN17315_c0_g1~~TRINITY_DN17315_c0_g1_i1.p1  ORF type:complete len:110 (+),score=12.44 TRINITY_DN17315_c0_g1_i1:59-388(+)